jgi:hypothetical protein
MADTKIETEDKETADQRKEAEKQAQVEAKERVEAEEAAAKQNAEDIETFFSFHRGEMLVRDNRGCLDMAAARAAYEAEKAERED